METPMPRRLKSNGQGQGMNWIRKEKRLAIYLRDGLACCYCGEGTEDGAQLTLDHLVPYIKGGLNEASNLITACNRCNASRRERPWTTFVTKVAQYRGIPRSGLVRHIRNTVRRPINVDEARSLMARRGGFVQACQREEVQGA